MIELVGERGFAVTTVADVIERAGVSRKTFYEHFENREQCFLAIYDEIVAKGLARVRDASSAPSDLAGQFGAGLRVLAEHAARFPAVMRFVLVEPAALGLIGVTRRERLLADYEAILRSSLGVAPRPGPIANPMLRGVIGGVLKVFSARVQNGTQRQVPLLVPDLARWAFSYYPLPPSIDAIRELTPAPPSNTLLAGRAPGSLSPWSASGRGRSSQRTRSMSRSFVVHAQRERVLDAVAQLSAEKGYAKTTVEDIAGRAAISLAAFYEHFVDKEDAFLVAYEVGHGKGRAIVERVHDAQSDWPRAVRAGVAALLEFLACEPAFAHLAVVDGLTATPSIAERASKGIVRYAELLTPGFEQLPPERAIPKITIEAIAGGIFELCWAYAAQGHTRELTELAPWATYLALAPFIGTEAAGRLAAEPAD
jgi:AcrR family transcriptional regulator